MTKFLRFSLIFVFIFGLSMARANPPSSVTLTYDLAKQSLHVEAQHPSDRMDRYFLRTLVVAINGAEVKRVYLDRQKLAWGLSEDVDLPANPGDHITAQLFCTQGGSGEGAVDIPADDKEKVKPSNDQKTINNEIEEDL